MLGTFERILRRSRRQSPSDFGKRVRKSAFGVVLGLEGFDGATSASISASAG